jgi:hypothetical protein
MINLDVIRKGNVSTIKRAISMAAGIACEKQTLYLDRSAEKLTNNFSIGELMDTFEIEGTLDMQLIVDSAKHCTLQTGREANIGHRGFVFDVHAKTTIEFHALTVHVQDTDDQSLELAVYVCPTGSFAANFNRPGVPVVVEQNGARRPTNWTLAGRGRIAPPLEGSIAADGTVGSPLRRHASIALVRDIALEYPVQMSPGDTCGVYLHVSSQRSGVVFHRGDTSSICNDHIEIEQGISTKSDRAFEQPGSNPYAFAGVVHYSAMQ